MPNPNTTPSENQPAGGALLGQPPVTHRAFGDVDATRKGIFDGILKATKEKYPIENQRYSLSLASVGYKEQVHFTPAEQKSALMSGHSLVQPLHGEWQLTDKASGQLVDKKAGIIAHVPWITPRGTFIYSGNEFTVANQMRLKPGVYSRVKDNGIYEAHINTKPGTGPSMRVYMEPTTGIFRLGVGQSELKLYPILKSIGVTDDDISKHWGPELLQKNMEAADPRAVSRAFAKLVRTRADEGAEKPDDEEAVSEPEEEAVEKEAAAEEIDPDWTCPLCNSKLKGIPCTKYRGHHFHRNCFARATKAQKDKAADTLDEVSEKEAEYIAAEKSDRKWSYLWHTGKLTASSSGYVLLSVHKGLCEAAYKNLKDEGIECQPHYDNPHITVLRPDEVEKLKKKHGHKWEGVAQIGQSFRFHLQKMVNLVPHSWDEMARVWFIECGSPELKKYRRELGFSELPQSEDKTHDQRFHVTVAVQRATRKAAELFTERRAECSAIKEAADELGEEDSHAFLVDSIIEEIFDRSLTKTAAQKPSEGDQLKEVFDKMELDPETTALTLGTPHPKMTSQTILRASQKLLNISKGTEKVDDRDSLAFQNFHGPEDFFAERIRKDAGQTGRKLLWKSTLRGHLKHVPSGVLTKQLNSVLLNSGMGQPIEEVNPSEIYDQQHRVIRMGEGGISDANSVPMESRMVQPSHFGYIDPVRAPESGSIGVDSRVTHGAVKGSDGKVYTSMFNLRTKKNELVPADQAARKVVAFPGEEVKNGYVRALVNAKQIEYVPMGKVDYVLPHTSSMFNTHSNLIPMVNAANAGRLLMGSKMLNQALSLRNAEAPLVQTAHPDGGSFEDWFGQHMGTAHSPIDGIVTKVSKDGITVKDRTGKEHAQELYNNFIFNRKTFLHNTPVVEVGAQVHKGDLLAKSNYTDHKGTSAIGTNLRVGFMPYRGLNYEDAIVVSASAAKRLSSEHAYQHPIENPKEMDIGRKQFISIFPGKFKPEQLKSIADNGTIKPGTVVHRGDPLILALHKNQVDAVHKSHKTMFTDGATLWEHDADGVVTDVVKTKEGGFNVVVKSYAPLQEGDKLAGRHGNKGVVSSIVPDAQMPHDSTGQHMEILLNPLGVISRGNPAQMFEALLGKVARKRGEPYKLESFNKENWIDFVTREANKHGVKMTENLSDPTSGRQVPDVLTGDMFIMKLHHTSESKASGRDIGGYTSEGLPAKGGPEGAKRISNMEMNALLSHGAINVIRDAHLVRGQRNDDYWKLFRLGMTPPSPKEPFVYKKFLSFLAGSGINLKKKGDRMQLFALTDKDVDGMADGEIQNANTVSGDKFEPVPGGLFDEHLTGGHAGSKWSKIVLHEPTPNPVMEEPIRRLLGLTQKSYEKLLSGEEPLRGESGGAGVKKLLAGINIDEEIRRQEATIDSGSVSKRDGAAKVLGYLKTMKENGTRPEDWVLSRVPVLPPSMRPITAFNNMQLTADPNYLYRDLFLVNSELKDVKEAAGPEAANEERLRLYNAFKAVTGLGDPVQSKTQEKGVSGLLRHVFGKGSPKFGLFQRRVVGTAADVVGRATITPNPELSMDQVGLPEEKAWTIYRPFIVRRLVRNGMPATAAVKSVTDRGSAARQAMEEEVKVRPVMINRAPTLHKYGFMAAWPVLVKGHTLQLSPVVTPGFSCVGRVPVLDDGIFKIVDLKDFSHKAELPGQPGVYSVSGIKVLAHLSGGGFGWNDVTKYHVHKQLEALEVTYGRQRKVTVSQDHSLYCFNTQSGRCVKTFAKDAVGKLTPRVKTTPAVFNTVLEISGPDQTALRLTEAFGWWLGAVIGDGWISQSGEQYKGVCLSGSLDSPVLSAWALSSLRLFNIAPGKPSDRSSKTAQSWGASRKLTLNNGNLACWLEFLVGRGAKAKHLPEFVQHAPVEFRRGLLAGLLDTDGHLGLSKTGRFNATFTTASLGLAEQVSWLFASLGVDSNFIAQTNNFGREHWVVYPSVCDLASLGLRLECDYKAKILNCLREAAPSGKNTNDVVPITADECHATLRFYAGTAATSKKAKCKILFHSYAKLRLALERGYIGRFILGKIIEQAGAAVPDSVIQRWRAEEHWEKVTEVKEVEKCDMYDLTVSGDTSTFVLVNKMAVFDTADFDGDAMNYHVPTTDDAVNDAVTKMMPSKNLKSIKDFKVHYLPNQEFVMGLYLASHEKNGKVPPRVFATRDAAVSAYKRGEIGASDRVVVRDEK